MPYIAPEDYETAAASPEKPGELNYAITMKAIEYLEGGAGITDVDFYKTTTQLVTEYLDRVGMSYTNANAVIGVLDCAGRELKRRVTVPDRPDVDARKERALKKLKSVADILYSGTLSPYEDEKIEENGDVYPASVLGLAEADQDDA